MKVLRQIYRVWLGLEWMLWIVIIYPIYGPMIMIKSLRNACHFVNVFYWARFIFLWVGIPVFVKGRKKLKRKTAYVICANHSSYLDIPMMFLTYPRNFTIIGKAELNKIPFFGFMFKNIYIAVDRKSRESKFKSFKASLKSIDDKTSVVFFPEGTIAKHRSPELLEFQDGAFRVAIQKKVPIVPVTMPHNWIVLHDSGQEGMRWKPLKVIIHDPIDTSEMTVNDVDALKDRVRNIIQEEMYKQNPKWVAANKEYITTENKAE